MNNRWVRPVERSPLHPGPHLASYGVHGQNPHPPGTEPPPYDPLPTFPGRVYQPRQVHPCRQTPSRPRSKTNIATLICLCSIFFIVSTQAMVSAFFYDLPAKLAKYGRATAVMYEQERAMRREATHLKGERAALENERKRWEKARGDRVPPGAFWDPLSPAPDCLAYGKREYQGALKNIPDDWTDMDACMNMPVKIKGAYFRRPDRCVYVEGSPHIHGVWTVDRDQVDCKPWHIDITDKGCINRGSGTRRIEAWVVGINDKPEQDWRLLCESTPFTWNHITYNSPTHCDAGIFGKKYAMWDVPDSSC